MATERSAPGSINRRLTSTVALSTGVSLLLACAMFTAYDRWTGREALLERASMVAQLVGINSAVPLSFEDRVAAGETLAGLGAARQVMAAVIYDRGGQVFAQYVSEPLSGSFRAPPLAASGHELRDAQLHLFQPIEFQGAQVGSLYLLLDASSLTTRTQIYAALVVLLLAVSTAGAGIFAARLRREISLPLGALVAGSEAMARGDLSTRVPEASANEIGTLAHAFNAMGAGLRGLIEQVGQSIAEVSEVSGALEERADKLTRDAERQSHSIRAAASSIEQMGRSAHEVNSGVENLSEKAHETSSSIIEMDATVGEIAAHMEQLNAAAETTGVAVEQLTSNIGEIVKGVDTLKRATEEAVGRLHELGTSVKQVERNAVESRALSEDSSRGAAEGVSAVGETVEAMGEISSSFDQVTERVSALSQKSQSIDEVVQVINSVADQTNLLSLNAAIIAAQAGEQGRAFSVVADQVRALAQSTHRSTAEIAQLIAAVKSETAAVVAAVQEGSGTVERGVARSKLAGEVLRRIMEKNATSTERVREIAEATLRQSDELERLDVAVRQVGEIVTQINEYTHDQHGATVEITQAVENVRRLSTGVRRSTEDHRRGSSLITKAVAGIADMIRRIGEATRAQAGSSETIEDALRVFSEVNEETTRGADAIGANVSTLAERSRRLGQEIGRFNIR